MKNPRPIQSGDEADAFTRWRRLYCYLQRPGAVKDIKRRYHRKERRWARRDIEDQREGK
jgi:hypothetical protein